MLLHKPVKQKKNNIVLINFKKFKNLKFFILLYKDDVFKFTKQYYAFLADNAHTDKLLVIVGPICSGKTTLISRLITDFPNFFDIPKRTTTRKPSANEVENKNFYFVARDRFFQVYIFLLHKF